MNATKGMKAIRELTADELELVSGGATAYDAYRMVLGMLYCAGSTTTTTNIAGPDGSIRTATVTTPNCTPA